MKDAKPRFRPDIKRHVYEDDGQGQSIVLEDPVANRFYRISSYEYELLKILDGSLTVSQAIERLQLQGRYFSPEHAAKLIGQFGRAGLLLGTDFTSSKLQNALRTTLKDAARRRSLSKMFFLFIPLVNPDNFLQKTWPVVRACASPITAALLLLLVPGALFLLVNGMDRLKYQILYFFNVQNLLILWVALTIAKLVHEFAHAFTAKGYGLRVPEMGIYLLLFFPRPYCDTTAAWQLADRGQRMAISLAGIISEVAVAVLACYVWYFSKPGIVNSIAFYLMAVSLASSLLFNGNPLLKFDGYFVLSDWLRMPNLQSKSLQYLRYLLLNQVLGIDSIRTGVHSPKERGILLTYGILSFLYRVLIVSGIVAAIYYKFDKSIGLLLGAMGFGLFIVRPIVTASINLTKRRSEMHPRTRGLLISGSILILAFFLLTRPWSDHSVFPCHLDSARIQQISVPAEAPVKAVFVRQGDYVNAGDPLFSLDSIPLEYLRKDKEVEKQLIEKEISIIENQQKDLEKLQIKAIELSQTEDAISKVQEDLKAVVWIAPFPGAVTKLSPHLQPGAEPGKGSPVGELADLGACLVIGLIPETDVSVVKTGSEVEIWFPVMTGRSYTVRVSAVVSFRAEDLEGSPFSSRFGGEIATDSRQQSGKDAPIEPHYVCKIDFSNPDKLPLGMTGRVVVKQPPRSLLSRMVSAAYQIFHRETVF